jgi:uncharacterized protein (TIGR02001 family)
MATRRVLSIGASCIVLHGALLHVQSAHAQQQWSGSIGAATDYIYRGVTQSQGQPAIQGGIQISGSDWSAGLWGSGVNLNREGGAGGYELNLHATRAWSWGPDWVATLGVTHYEYLDDAGALDYDHDEISASLSFQQRLTASIAWSPNTTRYQHTVVQGRATAYELTFQQPLSPRWSFFAGAGHYDLRDLIDEGYSYWSAGLSFNWSAVQIDAAHIGADRSAERLFGYLAGSRWTGALTVRF